MPAQTDTEPPHQNDLVQIGKFISPMIYLNSAITSMNGKPRLVREKNAIPLLSKPALVCTCPINDLLSNITPKHIAEQFLLFPKCFPLC